MDSSGHIHHLTEEEIEQAQKGLDRDYCFNERKMVSLSEDEVEECQKMGLQQRKGWMRNKPCPCDSGKKFKKCCWSKFS